MLCISRSTGGYFCRRIDEKFLDSIDGFIREPAIYQEEIDGEDIRVNLLNKKVLSAHIIERSDDTLLDYRTDSSYEDGKGTYRPIELPSSVVEFCVKAAEVLQLTFTGIDLKCNSNGEYFLIECNSMPAYLDIEFKTGTPITDALSTTCIQKTKPMYIQVPIMERKTSRFSRHSILGKKSICLIISLYSPILWRRKHKL